MSATEVYPKTKVYVGSTPGSLSYETKLFAVSVSLATAPGTSSAQVSMYYGSLSTGGNFQTVEPLNLRKKYIRIDYGGDTVFSGKVVSDSESPEGIARIASAEVPSGTMTYTAVGADGILDRVHYDVTRTSKGDIDVVYAFNGSSQGIEKNKSLSELKFHWTKDETDYWTAADIVDYLLTYANEQTDWTWSVSGAAKNALTAITKQVDPAGKTIKQLFDEIINPVDGLTYYVETSGNSATIKVISISDITIGDLPANSNNVSFSTSIDKDKTVTSHNLSSIDNTCYGKIKIVGEPIRVTATLAIRDLEPSWTEAEQAEYLAEESDSNRATEKYEKVFRQFKLPEDWDGLDFAGLNCIPVLDSDCNLHFDQQGTFIPGAHVFERKIDSERSPLVMLKDGKWFELDKKNNDKPTVGLKFMDTGPELLLKAESGIIMAPPAFIDDSVQTQYAPSCNYRNCVVTLSFYTDTLLQYEIAGEGDGTKVIQAPGLTVWAVPNLSTKFSISETAPAQFIRDDRIKLKRIAQLAKAWYGRSRNALSLSKSVIRREHNLGKLVDSVTVSSNPRYCGTVVTRENYSFSDNDVSYSMNTEFMDINLTKITKRVVMAQNKEINRRLKRIEERTEAISIHQHGGTSNQNSVPVKIISHDSGNTYIGKIWDPITQTEKGDELTLIAANMENDGPTLRPEGIFEAWWVADKTYRFYPPVLL